jgi:hypothetical protein
VTPRHAPAIDIGGPNSSVLSVECASKEPCSIGCVLCAERTPFLMPTHVLRAFENQSVLLFSGAGVSTEGGNVYPYSLHQDIASELGTGAEEARPRSARLREMPFNIRNSSSNRPLDRRRGGAVRKHSNGIPGVVRRAINIPRVRCWVTVSR